MKCPVCKNITLLMSERNGIEIDYCPECRGIWLDRGELDKLLEKNHNLQNKENINQESNNTKKNTVKRKRESFMSDIFDIFGD